MEIKKMYMVGIQKNDDGKIKEVFEVKTINEEKFKQLKTEASEHKAKVQLEKQEQEKKDKLKENKLYIKSIAIAKALFNELVDSGKAETTNEFEEMFDSFILGGSFDTSIAPIKFLNILERLKQL